MNTPPALPIDLGDGLRITATDASHAQVAYDVVDAERERLREWLPWVDATVSVEVEAEFLRGVELVNAARAGLHGTIWLEGRFAGLVGLRIAALRRSAEVGYWLGSGALGRGLMTRSVAALVDVAFGQLGLHRVELQAATGNLRSRAVAERLGMTLEGVRREAEELHHGFVDLAMYGLLAPDWPGAAEALRRAVPDTGVSTAKSSN